MRGSITKRGDRTWRLTVELERDPLTGRRRRRTETVHGTRREAEARLAQLIHEAETGLAVEPSRLTVADWLRTWLDQAAPRLRATTRERYRATVEGRLIPQLGAYRLQGLRPVHIQAAHARWLQEGLQPATVASFHRVLGRALREAERLQLIARVPTAAVSPPPVQGRRLELSEELVSGALSAVRAQEQPWRALGLLILHTGMRRGEACGLRWADLDLDAGLATIRVTRTIAHDASIVTGPPKTRAGERAVILLPEVVDALRDWRRLQVAERLAAGPAWQGEDWVFTSGVAPLRPDAVTHWWTRTARTAGIPLRLHDLRHLAATIMARQGVPPRVIAAALGHSRASFTLDVYAGQPDLAALREAAEVLGDVLKRAASGEFVTKRSPTVEAPEQ